MPQTRQYRVAIQTFGCKLNQAESESMARDFSECGYALVEPHEAADIYVVNTCTVTAEADRKVRQWLRAARNRSPEALLVSVGCGAARPESGISSLSDLAVDNTRKHAIVDVVKEHLVSMGVRPSPRVVPPDVERPLRTRATLKVQEGCSTQCAYCIVPSVRPDELSVPLEEVVRAATARVAEGYRELVLTGTKVGTYRDGEAGLAELLRAVLAVPGNARIRLSSLQPQELTDALLDLWENSRLCPHFHLSLQSGSDSVLKRMGRAYSLRQYDDAVASIRMRAPGCAITTDVIVGFPGETREEFEESLKYCDAIGFARIHVFPFSPRPGTRAASMMGRICGPELQRRKEAMNEVARQSLDRYARSWLHRQVEALWEGHHRGRPDVWSGTTGNYLHVLCESNDYLHNRLETVVPVDIEGDRVWVRR